MQPSHRIGLSLNSKRQDRTIIGPAPLRRSGHTAIRTNGIWLIFRHVIQKRERICQVGQITICLNVVQVEFHLSSRRVKCVELEKERVSVVCAGPGTLYHWI